MDEREHLLRAARALAAVRELQEQATEQARAAVRAAVAAGVSEVEAARLVGVDRMTVRRWLGK
jgi:transposase